MQRRRNHGLVVLRPHKNSLRDHPMRNKRRHVQATLMSAHGEALSSGEFPREMHPLRPKPVVSPDHVQPSGLVVARNANHELPNLFHELIRISLLSGKKILERGEHAYLRTSNHYTCALNLYLCLCEV